MPPRFSIPLDLWVLSQDGQAVTLPLHLPPGNRLSSITLSALRNTAEHEVYLVCMNVPELNELRVGNLHYYPPSMVGKVNEHHEMNVMAIFPGKTYQTYKMKIELSPGDSLLTNDIVAAGHTRYKAFLAEAETTSAPATLEKFASKVGEILIAITPEHLDSWKSETARTEDGIRLIVQATHPTIYTLIKFLFHPTIKAARMKDPGQHELAEDQHRDLVLLIESFHRSMGIVDSLDLMVIYHHGMSNIPVSRPDFSVSYGKAVATASFQYRADSVMPRRLSRAM